MSAATTTTTTTTTTFACVVSSKRRNPHLYPESNAYDLTFDRAFSNVVAVSLHSAWIPASAWNVEDGTIVVRDTIVSIRAGAYPDGPTLLGALNDAFEAVGLDVQASLDLATVRIAFLGSTPFVIEPGVSGLREVLGLGVAPLSSSPTDAGTHAIVAPGVLDLNARPTHAIVRCAQLDAHVAGDRGFDSLGVGLGCVRLGSETQTFPHEYARTFPRPISLASLSIRLETLDGRPLPTHGADHVLILLIRLAEPGSRNFAGGS